MDKEFKKIEQQAESYRMSMSPDAIPDLKKLYAQILNMFEFIESPEMVELERTNRKLFEDRVYMKYNAHVPIKIIGLIVEENRVENMEKLLDMFEMLEEVKSGRSNIHDAHKAFVEKLNEEMVYPQFGGKEGFEAKMKEMEEDYKKNKKK